MPGIHLRAELGFGAAPSSSAAYIGRRRNLLAKLGGWDDPCIISKQPAVSLVSSIEQNNASEMRPLLEVISAPQIMDPSVPYLVPFRFFLIVVFTVHVMSVSESTLEVALFGQKKI